MDIYVIRHLTFHEGNCVEKGQTVPTAFNERLLEEKFFYSHPAAQGVCDTLRCDVAVGVKRVNAELVEAEAVKLCELVRELVALLDPQNQDVLMQDVAALLVNQGRDSWIPGADISKLFVRAHRLGYVIEHRGSQGLRRGGFVGVGLDVLCALNTPRSEQAIKLLALHDACAKLRLLLFEAHSDVRVREPAAGMVIPVPATLPNTALFEEE